MGCKVGVSRLRSVATVWGVARRGAPLRSNTEACGLRPHASRFESLLIGSRLIYLIDYLWYSITTMQSAPSPAPAPAPVPASRQKSSKWFVRVDGEENYLRQKCRELSTCLDVESMLATFHTGRTQENPHTHFVIEMKTMIQKQSYAVRIRTHFNIIKKSQYALDVWDGNRGMGAVSYLFHEESAPILANVGFTDEELANARTACQAVQAVVAINAERSSGKLVNKALSQFEGQRDVTKYDILSFMLREIRDGNHYHPGMFRLKSFVEEVEIRRSSDVELENLAHMYAENLWR